MKGGSANSVAIVGMAVILPGSDSLESYWRNLVDGVDAITDVPPHRWDPDEFYDPAQAHRPDRVYCRRGGFVDEFVDFDPVHFGIMPASVGDIEAEQLIALRVAAAAIADAGGRDRLPNRERVGVIMGRGGFGSVAQGQFVMRVHLASHVRDLLRQLVPEMDSRRLDLVRERINESFGAFRPEGV